MAYVWVFLCGWICERNSKSVVVRVRILTCDSWHLCPDGGKETLAQMFEREMKKEKTLDQIRAKRGGGGGLKKKEWPNYRDYDDDVLRKLEDGAPVVWVRTGSRVASVDTDSSGRDHDRA